MLELDCIASYPSDNLSNFRSFRLKKRLHSEDSEEPCFGSPI
jgi:hypothetical protein